MFFMFCKQNVKSVDIVLSKIKFSILVVPAKASEKKSTSQFISEVYDID